MGKVITSYEAFETTEASGRRACEIINFIEKKDLNPRVIAIGGESGSGKSTTAYSLLLKWRNEGKEVVILHLDNYFKNIPEVNEKKRRTDLTNIGLPEINIDLLQTNVTDFINGKQSTKIPVLSESRMEFLAKNLDLSGIDILIVEGTFVLGLENLDLKVFLDFNYEKSKARRVARGRDVVDDFSEKVLELEHKLILPYKSTADIQF